MSQNIQDLIVDAYRRTHDHALDLVSDLSDEQLVWQTGLVAPSIGFHLWHLARWADLVQEIIKGPGTQIWGKERLAGRWGFAALNLGYAETGMGMDDDFAARLSLPAKALLVNYARQVFTRANRAVATAAAQQIESLELTPLAAEYFGDDPALVHVILRMMRHDNRHVGMIEALRGIQGVR